MMPASAPRGADHENRARGYTGTMGCGLVRRLGRGLGITLLASWLAVGALARPPLEVFFGPPEKGPDLAAHFATMVEGARETLDLAFYELRYDPLVEVILAAHRRRVRVRMVVDDDNFFLHDEEGVRQGDALNPFVARLVEAGVEVHHDNERSGLMHNKFAVVDGETLWTGSFNLTDTGARVNANNAVRVRSRALAAVYTSEFQEMFTAGQFGITSPRQGEQVVDEGGVRFEVLFGPEDDPNARIRELIAGATHEVLFMQFAFTSGDISQALLDRRAAVPELNVQGIFDRILHRATGPYGEFTRLTDNGVPVVIDNRPEGKLHHKVFILDADGPDPVVVLGSANASDNGNRANDENVLVIHDAAVARAYRDEFRRLYGQVAAARAEVFLRGLAIAGRRVQDADLVITSGGRQLEAIEIETPARWKPEEMPTIVVHRNGKAITGQVDMHVQGSRKIEIRRPQVERFGRNAYLVVKFKGLRIPDIHGGYSFYVRVKSPGGDWEPLSHQPSFQVLEDLSAETVSTMLGHLVRLHRRFETMKQVSKAERMLLVKHIDATRDQMIEVLVETVSEDDLRLARAVADFLGELDAADLDRVRRVVRKSMDLRRALRAAVVREVEGAEALATRLEALIAG